MINKKSPSTLLCYIFVIAAYYQYASFRKMCTPSIRNFFVCQHEYKRHLFEKMTDNKGNR